ncbi:MAG: hypothetical protein LVQ75_05585 [Candidatus Babeliales bacterium]|jgi:thymidylate kinase
MKTMTNGFLVLSKGIDGTGKTSIVPQLAQAFFANYLSAFFYSTEEPGVSCAIPTFHKEVPC